MTQKSDIAERGLDGFAPYLMNRIMRRYNQTLQARMADYDLSAPKMRALASLAVRDGLTVNELAVYSMAEQPTMSRTLDQLERAGLITRTVSEADSRVRHCSLTDAGRGCAPCGRSATKRRVAARRVQSKSGGDLSIRSRGGKDACQLCEIGPTRILLLDINHRPQF